MSNNNGGGPGGSTAATERQTLVEEGTQFKGSLSSSCPIVVRGRVEGDLAAPSLTVSPSGSVRGTVKVGELRSQGEIAGEFDADTIVLSGTVRDNTVIRAKTIEVKLAPPAGRMQVIFGECALEIGDAPSREKDKDASKGLKSKKASKDDLPDARPPSIPPPAPPPLAPSPESNDTA